MNSISHKVRRTFSDDSLSFYANGRFKYHGNVMDATTITMSMVSLSLLASVISLPLMSLWTAAFVLTGPVAVTAFLAVFNRNSIAVSTGMGTELARAYSAVKPTLSGKARRAGLRAVLSHDSALSKLYDAHEEVKAAVKEASAQSWSSPLLLEDLNAREFELGVEIADRIGEMQALADRFTEAENTDRKARHDAAEAAKAVKAVSALTTSRKVLNSVREDRVPAWELV